MSDLTPTQERKLSKIAKIVEDGPLAIAEWLFELEDGVEKFKQDLESEFEQRVKEIQSSMPNMDVMLESIRGKDADEEAIIAKLIDFARVEIGKIKPKDGETPTRKELEAIIRPLIPQVKDGKTPTPEEIVALIKPLIPSPIPGKDANEDSIVQKIEQDLPKLGTSIRDALELLQDGEKLDKKAIKGLEEWQKEIETIAKEKGTPMGVVSGRDLIKSYDLSDQLDGATKTFDLPANWIVLDVRSSSSPWAFRETVDYTYTPTSITFTSEIEAAGTLAAGQTLKVIYVVA